MPERGRDSGKPRAREYNAYNIRPIGIPDNIPFLINGHIPSEKLKRGRSVSMLELTDLFLFVEVEMERHEPTDLPILLGTQPVMHTP